jgi:hypothetical protein
VLLGALAPPARTRERPTGSGVGSSSLLRPRRTVSGNTPTASATIPTPADPSSRASLPRTTPDPARAFVVAGLDDGERLVEPHGLPRPSAPARAGSPSSHPGAARPPVTPAAGRAGPPASPRGHRPAPPPRRTRWPDPPRPCPAPRGPPRPRGSRRARPPTRRRGSPRPRRRAGAPAAAARREALRPLETAVRVARRAAVTEAVRVLAASPLV